MSSTPDAFDDAFHPSFTGGRQEREWILHALGDLRRDEWFTDVLFRVKGGKEATVYCCRAHPSTGLDLIAAKVYRPRIFRAMRNDSLYKDGRLTRSREGKYPDSRTARALRKRSRYGRFLDAAAWCGHEVATLERLHAAGADVPRVLVATHDAILMSWVGDEAAAAPVLHGLSLPPSEAEALLERLVENLRVLLGCYVVHADLSAFNVLLHEGAPTIIDLPQAVDAIDHPQAFDLFRRDVDRLGRWFVRQGVALDPEGLALDLWREQMG